MTREIAGTLTAVSMIRNRENNPVSYGGRGFGILISTSPEKGEVVPD